MSKRNTNKLTQQDYERMWGEDVPYSQVRISEEVRILGDGISRVFLVVEGEINPFTFEYVRDHRDAFADDPMVQQLLDHAENRNKFGYVVGAGEVNIENEHAEDFAEAQRAMLTATIIRMHEHVLDTFGLRKSKKMKGSGALAVVPGLVWNDATNTVEPVFEEAMMEDALMEALSETYLNHTALIHIVLGFVHDAEKDSTFAPVLARTIKKIAKHFNVEIEDVETFREHAELAVLVPFEVAPATFIEALISAINEAAKQPIFSTRYLATNVEPPTPAQIMTFVEEVKGK